MKKKLIGIFKVIGRIMISVGVGALVKNVLIMVTPPGAKAVIRVCMMVGGYFVGGLAAKAASDAFEVSVDETISKVEKINKLVDKHNEEIESILGEA